MGAPRTAVDHALRRPSGCTAQNRLPLAEPRKRRNNAAGNFSAAPGVDYCEKPRVRHPAATETTHDRAPAPDNQLVAAAAGGDRDAFGLLVTRYQDRLFNTLVRVGANPEDAADIVQDAFVQAYLKLASFQGASQFYTWLYRIAMNLSISRRRRKRPSHSLDALHDAAGEEPIDRGESPEGVALSHERVAAVQEALVRLADQPRRILVLREIEGASYEQIAEILELPIGTVRSRLFRARMQLREQLSRLNDERATDQGSEVRSQNR